MDAPLVNGYKKNFLIRRFLSTFLGGLRIYFPDAVPIYIYVTQILLFAYIPCICAIFLHLLNKRIMNSLIHTSIANGCCILIYAVFIQLFALCLQRKNAKKENCEQLNSLHDEEIFMFDSFWGPRTWLFLIPPKKSAFSIILHSLVAGMVGGLTLYYLHVEVKEYLLWNLQLQWAFQILGLWTLSVGVWPLIVGSPPEPALFHQLPLNMQDLSRSFHILTCILIHIVASHHPKVHWLFYVNCFGHILFAFCSVLWLLGVLPPLDAYILWVLEQWVFLLLGGSPTASDRKLFCNCILGTIVILILATLPDFATLAVSCATVGYLASLDWEFLLSFCQEYQIQDKAISHQPNLAKPARCLKHELIFYGLFFLGTFSLSFSVHFPQHKWYKIQADLCNMNRTSQVPLPEKPVFFQPHTAHLLWFCTMAFLTVRLGLHHMQRPFVFLWFRNPFYIHLKKCSPRFILTLSQVIHWGGPLLSLTLIHSLVGAGNVEVTCKKSYLESLFTAISCSFIFRQIWQFSDRTMLTLTLYMAVEKIIGQALKNSFWSGLDVSAKLHLFTLFLFWFEGAWTRWSTMVMFSITAVTEPKQRKLLNYFLLGINLGLMPILALACCICSILSLPLFPLFTLPLFLIGFPRPQRFWPYPVGYSANHCSDTIYYEQLVPHVVRGFHQQFLNGSLGRVDPGEFFLLRWEDRFFWIQVFEKGFGYQCYGFKGLELQETSCHTAEASRVDSIFSRAFNPAFLGDCWNKFWFHCLSPISTFSVIGYIDTRNVLTGVLDSPETLKVIKDYLGKALLYFLLEHRFIYGGENLSIATSIRQSSATSRLGSTESKTRNAFVKLPKAERLIGGSRISLRTASGEGSPSILSQNGRGSRMAWVSTTKLVLQDLKSSPPAPQTSIKEEEKEEVTVRPASWRSDNLQVLRSTSWDSKDDPLESQPREIMQNDKSDGNFISRFSITENEKRREEKPSVAPSKANLYLKIVKASDLTPDESTLLKIPLPESDSETESTKAFFAKSVPQRPRRESEPFHFADPSIPKINRNMKLPKKTGFNSSLSSSLSPSNDWITNSPFDEELLEDWQDQFPLSWFKYLLKRFGILKIERKKSGEFGNSTQSNKAVLGHLLRDERLEESYRTLLAMCCLTMLGLDVCYPSTSQVFKVFHGEIPSTKGKEWLKSKKDLLDIVLKSYRIAVKLSLDHVLVAPANSAWTDLELMLEEYSHDWFIGPDTEARHNGTPVIGIESSWNQAVKNETPNLFSIGYNDIKGVYTSHLLTLGDAEFTVGRLDCETVRSIWASLTGELLYLTNDDDERYSIQAHPVLLRNLTIQAAEPPLGYPIYSSPPLHMGPF